MKIRKAVETDYQYFPDIERDAAQVFCDFGLNAIADAEPTPAEYYAALPETSIIAVAEDTGGKPIGFAVVNKLDGQVYLKEISVRCVYSGKGIGRQLTEYVICSAHEYGYKTMALTTFADLPFNAPFYCSCGFADFIPNPGEYPELLSIRESETKNGLDLIPRICMVRHLI